MAEYKDHYENIANVSECQKHCQYAIYCKHYDVRCIITTPRTCEYFTYNQGKKTCTLKTWKAIGNKVNEPESGVIFASRNCNIFKYGKYFTIFVA